MTRETKIGLLVGLAFIIVIGILLSDHVTNSTEPVPAQLSGAGSNVRASVTAPGQAPPITQAPPIIQAPPVQPQQPVPTQRELAPRPQVVQVEVGGPAFPSSVQTPPSSVQPTVVQTTSQQTAAPRATEYVPVVTETPTSPLASAAWQHGEQIVPVDASDSPAPVASAFSTEKRYTAQSGDTLSHIALRQMGANTKANRDALIRANPSLQSNPDVVIAGRTYVIPSAPIVPAQASTASRTIVQQQTFITRTDTYVCKSGDSLWKIAEEQLGSGRLWTALRDLNRDVLKGSDTVQPGMTLRLPTREVASVN